MTRRRLKVLFVAPVEPWSRENGSSLITADLLEALAGHDGVELLPIFVRRPPPGYARSAPPELEGVLLDIPGLPRWLSVLKAVSLGSSPLRHRFDNQRVAKRIREVMSERGFVPDLVHVEHLPLVDIGLLVSRRLGVPLVYRAHNVESRLWARRLGLPEPFKGLVVRYMDRLEADAVRRADLTLFISQGDREWARERAPAARSDVLPCTLRLERYDAVTPTAPAFPAQLCFVGGMDWAPNEDGLRWFVQDVLPRIVDEAPRAGLAVLSRGASERPWLTGNPAVHIVPAEASAPALFAASQVSVAPLFQGGGVRIKIPESLALGCPVVATAVGGEGHDLPGLVRADTADDFAKACISALSRNGDAWARAALRESLEGLYGAARCAERLVALWSETSERGKRGSG